MMRPGSSVAAKGATRGFRSPCGPHYPWVQCERMFATSESPVQPDTPVREVPVVLAARVRPISEARQQLLPVVPALAPLLPDGALRRGSTAVVTGAGGGTTLAFSLLAGVSSAGCWCAMVGLADSGVVALEEL